jgi:hypothetical protein
VEDYVNTFLKMKQEASGWPEWCQNENDRWRYIRDYHEKKGILLDYNNIKKNPGLRALAKLMLNSFWGWFSLHVLHRVNKNLLLIFTGNTGMYSPLGGRILHLMSPSYCCISVTECCQNVNDRRSYIRDYHEKEGILLDYNNIKKNHGLRALAKLMLNSFWGKFGQARFHGFDVISVVNDHVLDRIKVDGQGVLVVESDASHFTYGRISILVGSGNLVGIVRRSTGSHSSLYHSSSPFEVVQLFGTIRTPCLIRRCILSRVYL